MSATPSEKLGRPLIPLNPECHSSCSTPSRPPDRANPQSTAPLEPAHIAASPPRPVLQPRPVAHYPLHRFQCRSPWDFFATRPDLFRLGSSTCRGPPPDPAARASTRAPSPAPALPSEPNPASAPSSSSDRNNPQPARAATRPEVSPDRSRAATARISSAPAPIAAGAAYPCRPCSW